MHQFIHPNDAEHIFIAFDPIWLGSMLITLSNHLTSPYYFPKYDIYGC